VLGTSLLIEESGTTDFGGILLRYFAAEGVVQGHEVHVLGMGETWGRELPGLSCVTNGPSSGIDESGIAADRMKIAWRYERLGEFGRGGCPLVVSVLYSK
jgi:elongator complex protein 4